jgi:hypothetical protein
MTVKIPCQHTSFGHITYRLLCPQATLAQRVMTLFLGIAGIYFVSWAYQLCQTAYKNLQDRLAHQASLEHRPMNKLAHLALLKNYSHNCQQVILKAVARVQNEGIDKPKKFAGRPVPEKTHQPVNSQITYLEALYQRDFDYFSAALKQFHPDPWRDNAVRNAAKQLVETSYTECCLALEDVDEFLEKLTNVDNPLISKEELFTSNKYYVFETIFRLPDVYRWTRGRVVHNETENAPFRFPTQVNQSPDPYHESGTLEHSWKELYNDYCDRIRKYGLYDLLSEHQKQWFEPDRQGTYFNVTPVSPI